MSNVEVVQFAASPPDADLVKRLEEALEKAKSGDLVDAAVVGAIRDEDGVHPFWWVGGRRRWAVVLAALAIAQNELIQRTSADAENSA